MTSEKKILLLHLTLTMPQPTNRFSSLLHRSLNNFTYFYLIDKQNDNAESLFLFCFSPFVERSSHGYCNRSSSMLSLSKIMNKWRIFLGLIKHRLSNSSARDGASDVRRKDGLIVCLFCSKEYSSRELPEHFLSCGNKTELCPNCHKLIQRAIFAYHYESNCSDLLEHQDEQSTRKTTDQPIPSTLIYCEFCANRCLSEDYQMHWVNTFFLSIEMHSFIQIIHWRRIVSRILRKNVIYLKKVNASVVTCWISSQTILKLDCQRVKEAENVVMTNRMRLLAFLVPSTERRVLRKKISLCVCVFVCLFVCHRVKRTFSKTILSARDFDTFRGNSMWATRIRGPFPLDDNGC